MIRFLYRCFYILFQYYAGFKREIPWASALLILMGSLLCYSMTLLGSFDVLDIVAFTNAEDSPSTRKGKALVYFIIPASALIWCILHYVIFNLAKASKADGQSERYAFTPAKRDKIIAWLFCLLSFGSIFILVGIRYLLGFYD